MDQQAKETRMIELYQSGYSLQDVANVIDGYSSSSAVMRVLERNGIKRRPYRIYALDQSVFDEIDDQESAYWLGFIYADGCVTARNQIKVCLHHKDINHLYKLRDFYKTNMPVHSWKRFCELCISSNIIADNLSAMGIIPKRGQFNLTLPFLSPHLEHHFIRGLFDGDGCISTNHHHVVFTNKRDILEWIRDKIIVNAGANCNKIRTRSNTCEVSWGGKEIAPRILAYLYQGATIYLDRKYKRAKRYL